MTGYVAKKSFFSLWDNLLTAFLLNLGYLAVVLTSGLLIVLYRSFVSGSDLVVPTVLLGLGVILLSVYSGGAAGLAWDMVNFEKPRFSSFMGHLSRNFLPSLLVGLVSVFAAVALLVSLPFYAISVEGFLGLFVSAILICIVLNTLLAFQYIYAFLGKGEKGFLKAARKGFILYFDNPGYTLFVWILGLFATLISCFGLLLFPGITYLLCLQCDAVRLRMLKYDWLEEHPDALKYREPIPCASLLQEDKERLGKRSFRNFFFAWKE
jgi:hypothetical protein